MFEELLPSLDVASIPVPVRAPQGPRALPAISPPELLAELQQVGEGTFERTHQGAAFLAVRLRDDAPELEEGLKLVTGRMQPARPVMSALAFKTKALSGAEAAPLAWGAKGSVRPKAVPRALAKGPHHVLRLGKRADLDAAYPERISVGRAANKDIVLRHTSISKFHAWFEIDEQLIWYVSDAGSTNHTFVSGVQLEPRERTPVLIGSSLQFGSVEAILLDPSTLWAAVREP